MLNERLLPEGFEALEPFCEEWALPHNMDRYKKRVGSSMTELKEFYDAVEPRAEEALALLDRTPLSELDGSELRLLYLCLTLIDVSLAIEVYRTPILRLSPAPSRFSVTMEGMTAE